MERSAGPIGEQLVGDVKREAGLELHQDLRVGIVVLDDFGEAGGLVVEHRGHHAKAAPG